jgi:hypothetical protein
VLYVTWIYKRSGACFKRQVCFRGVVLVVCDWDIYEEWYMLYVTGMLQRSDACCM